ncbi:DUF58 domain-containing protein [Salinibacterium sp. SYSU T00001]|uniref:DUF58 domain-containing protein n=1 Tax=Homoserinimonas sedimenticola TaxID=2986805 RepID=UPI0022360BE8|nr:DUF58 domain-containing protein [Salinibacterium sedimenticola]MCW4386689.1 DUF58 domain-containing protein [Salinibacterium sedimenticola]
MSRDRLARGERTPSATTPGTARVSSRTALTGTGRSRSRGATRTSYRGDPGTTTSTVSNTRSRIVGNRDGILADLIVTVVRSARALAGGLATVSARVGSVVTPLGWSMVGVVVLSFFFAHLVGWPELLAAAYSSLVLVLVAIIYLVGRNAFTIDLSLPHSRVVVGETASARITIDNPSRHRVFGVKAEVPVGTGIAEFALPGLTGGSSFSHEFAVPTSRRGMLPIGPVRTVRADPIGLVRREIAWTDVHELYVHPRTTAIPSTSTGLIRDLEGNPTRDITSSDVSFHALREYAPGDERRYIHWKSTAKTGTYMVRQFEETRRSHLVISLSLAASDYASDEEFEMAVSVAGSLGIRAIRDVRNISVVVGASTPEFARHRVFAVRALSTLNPGRLLDDLALVERDAASLPLGDMARVVADQVAGVSVAFLICGSTPSPGELRAASTRFPSGVEVVAIVCDPETVPGLRRVPGLSVLTIGYLEDLTRSLARSAAA